MKTKTINGHANKTKTVAKLIQHTTSGGAIYLTDNHNFSKAKIVIRLDGGAELIRCEIKK